MSSKLPVLSGEKLIKFLVQEGFIVRRQSGSHVIMQRPNGRLGWRYKICKDNQCKYKIFLDRPG